MLDPFDKHSASSRSWQPKRFLYRCIFGTDYRYTTARFRSTCQRFIPSSPAMHRGGTQSSPAFFVMNINALNLSPWKELTYFTATCSTAWGQFHLIRQYTRDRIFSVSILKVLIGLNSSWLMTYRLQQAPPCFAVAVRSENRPRLSCFYWSSRHEPTSDKTSRRRPGVRCQLENKC